MEQRGLRREDTESLPSPAALVCTLHHLCGCQAAGISSLKFRMLQWRGVICSLSLYSTLSPLHLACCGPGYRLVDGNLPPIFHLLFLWQSKVKHGLFCGLYAQYLHVGRRSVERDFQKGAAEKWAHLNIINTNVLGKRDVWLMVYIWVHYLLSEPLSSMGVMFSGRPFETTTSRQLSSITDKHGSSLSAPSLSLSVGLIMTGWCRGEDQSINNRSDGHTNKTLESQNKILVAMKTLPQVLNVKNRVVCVFLSD